MVTGHAAVIGRRDRRLDNDLFQPDVLLPDQFRAHATPSQAGPERRLMLAVLEDALGIWQKYATCQTPEGKSLFLEADDWFRSNDRKWLFSFESLCVILDLNPDYIREGLTRWRARLMRGEVVGRVADMPD